jgi:hypothetical protein
MDRVWSASPGNAPGLVSEFPQFSPHTRIPLPATPIDYAEFLTPI